MLQPRYLAIRNPFRRVKKKGMERLYHTNANQKVITVTILTSKQDEFIAMIVILKKEALSLQKSSFFP